ncbi:MAG: hypothetical protein Q7T01_05050 [bacterium]|nr:hypothetical protein [bacterium]
MPLETFSPPQRADQGSQQPPDLQKEFHQVRREGGEEAAIQFLVEHRDQNAEYVTREAFRLSQRIGRKLVRLTTDQSRTYTDLLERASAAELRAQLYVAFRDLSERQKTKSGGFRKYAENALHSFEEEEGGEAAPHRRSDSFNARVLASTDRAEYEDSGDGVHSFLRTERLNYRAASEARQEEVTAFTENVASLEHSLALLDQLLGTDGEAAESD